jgi:hypothetical protein
MTDVQILLIGIASTVVFAGYLWLCDKVRS